MTATSNATFNDGWTSARDYYLKDARRDLEEMRDAAIRTLESYRDSYRESHKHAINDTILERQYAAQVSLLEAVLESLDATMKRTIEYARVNVGDRQ